MLNLTRLKYYIKLLFGQHPFVRKDISLETERHGTEYGGWAFKKDSIHAGSIVYSVGIGEDISFDKSVIDRYQCTIFAYDPTPRVGQWLSTQLLHDNFKFYQIGLGAENGSVTFYSPVNPNHISHSARPSSAATKGTAHVLPVKTLSALMHENGHTYIDLLKMDIEGFEYGVIDFIADNKLEIGQILVEFHHGMYSFSNADTRAAIQIFRKLGYKLFHISDSGREYSFIK